MKFIPWPGPGQVGSVCAGTPTLKISIECEKNTVSKDDHTEKCRILAAVKSKPLA